MTDTFTSTPSSAVSLPGLEALADEDEEDEEEDGEDRELELEDEELLLGIDGDEGWLDDEELGIDAEDGDEAGDELGIEGAELGEDEELGIDGIELLELLELEVVSQPASNRVKAETVSTAFRVCCVTGVLMLLFLLPVAFVTQREREKFGYTRPSGNRADYRLTSGGRGQHPQENIGISSISLQYPGKPGVQHRAASPQSD